MSPYIVKTGVRSGQNRYGPGDRLPDGIGDEAMVEAGAIEWQGSAREETQPDGLGDFLGVTAPAAREAESATDLEAMDMKALREAAKAAGINSFGKSKDELRAELKAVKP